VERRVAERAHVEGLGPLRPGFNEEKRWALGIQHTEIEASAKFGGEQRAFGLAEAFCWDPIVLTFCGNSSSSLNYFILNSGN
jgi:hypothetical protein